MCDRLDSTDDFIEVERLVSLPSEPPALVANKEREISAASMEALAAKEAELQAANMQCGELKDKLVSAEKQLSAVSSKNAANELNLFSLQQKLNMIFTNLEGGDEARAMEEIRSAVLASQYSSVDRLQAHVMKISKVSSSSVSSEAPSLEEPSQQRSSSPTSDGKPPNIESDLSKAASDVIRLVEELVLESKAQQQRTNYREDCLSNDCVHSTKTQKTSDLDSSLTKLKASTEQFLRGKLELIELMKELSSVLNHIRIVGIPAAAVSQIDRERHKQEASKAAEQEEFSDAGSPFSNLSNCDGSEVLAAKVSSVGERPSALREPRADEDLRKLRTEKAALESHMKAELSRMDKMEEMLAQLQQEKSQLVVMLEEEKEKLETAKSQLLDDEQLIANLRVRLASAEFSRNMADEHLTSATAENSKLVLKLQECQAELTKSHEMLEFLERSMDGEHVKKDELQAKVEELQGLLERASEEKSHMGVGRSAEKNAKEEGIMNATERLAECQRTILVLGKQIQNMASARASLSTSINPSARDIQEGSLSKDDKHADGNFTTISRRKQSIHSDPGDFSISDIAEEELIAAAKGGGQAEVDDKNPTTHEGYIQHPPSSPEADTSTQIVPYVAPKTAPPGKKSARPFGGAVDLAKSLNLGSSASPRRGNSFSRFFTRNKKASS